MIAAMAVASDQVPASADLGDTIPGPTILFWMVCFALNAMAAPSGSDVGFGYEPRWLLSMSPVVPLFDAVHMVGTWLLLYFKAGRSYRLATAETLLSRITRGSLVTRLLRKLQVSAKMRSLNREATRLYKVVPKKNGHEDSEGDQSTEHYSVDTEKARSVIAELELRVIRAERKFDTFFRSGRASDRENTVEEISPLLVEASKSEIFLRLLLGLDDKQQEKHDLWLLVSQFERSATDVQRALEDCQVPDYTKASLTIKSLIRDTGYRWFCFGLGVLPQFIKLFGSSGISNIQICGAGYLASWSVFEALILAAKKMKLDKPDAQLNKRWDPDGALLRDDPAPSNSSEVDQTPVDRPGIRPGTGFSTIGVEYETLSMLLGVFSISAHTQTCVQLFSADRVRGEVYYILALGPIWINDFNLSDLWSSPQPLAGVASLVILFSSALGVVRLGFALGILLAFGDEQRILNSKRLLVFTGAFLASRIVIGWTCVSDSARLKMLTCLRVAFCCVPSLYYFLVNYDESGTKLLSWAEWLG